MSSRVSERPTVTNGGQSRHSAIVINATSPFRGALPQSIRWGVDADRPSGTPQRVRTDVVNVSCLLDARGAISTLSMDLQSYFLFGGFGGFGVFGGVVLDEPALAGDENACRLNTTGAT
jgi:hypothetical protein